MTGADDLELAHALALLPPPEQLLSAGLDGDAYADAAGLLDFGDCGAAPPGVLGAPTRRRLRCLDATHAPGCTRCVTRPA